jgi:lipopolysaccharide biosynthesis protein
MSTSGSTTEPDEGPTCQAFEAASLTVSPYVARLRHIVRLRTRLRMLRARASGAQFLPVAGLPADFGAWVQRAPDREFGSFPDAWKERDDLPIAKPAKVGVVLHAYYRELLPELFERLRRIPVSYDLWISNATGEAIELPEEMGRLLNARELEVENRGRDILALTSLVNAGYLDPYLLILKVHTKRSRWRADHDSLGGEGASWRLDLLDAVLGTEDDIRSILSAFVEQPDLGLVTADDSILGPEFWGDNEVIVANLLRRIELKLDARRLRFAAGSIYWGRGFVLQGLRALNLGAGDFEREQGQVNATTAHAIERVLGVLIEEAGVTLVGRSALTSPSNLESYRRLEMQAFRPRARLVAFYLPQFHPIPENDKWWGEGFTEWMNVTAAQPVYQGHYQPRLPRDLGFYDLRLDDVRRMQLSLAEASGIEGFMYYYYWFAGKRLLDAPIQSLLESDIPQPFCIMWANENWTRRWDGRESDVLIAQDYERVPADRFIDDILPYLSDERYMTINGRKIVAIYRPAQFADVADVVASWRSRARAVGVGELFVMNVDVAARFDGIRGSGARYGLDGSLSFPPHNYPWQWLPHDGLGVNPRFQGNILSYQALAQVGERRLQSPLSPTFFPGVMVAFDNTARRQWAPDVWYGSNPYTFRRWLAAAVRSVQDRDPDEGLVFINAWNEWAESAVLEPTDRFGRTFLLAVRDVVLG